MNELVRLQALDGVWEVGGADRRAGIWPEGMNCVWDRWGALSARFSLKREPGVSYPDLGGFTPVEVERGGGVWEGFVDQAPEGDDFGLSIECVGWPDHGNDDPYGLVAVHARVADWRDARSLLSSPLGNGGGFNAAGQVSNEGGITLTFPQNLTVGPNSKVGVILDLGPLAGTAKRAVIEWESSNNDAAMIATCRSFADPNLGTIDTAFNLPMNGGAAGTSAGGFTTGYRYVGIWLEDTGASHAPGADVWFRVKTVMVFTNAAYESGGVSILKASDVLRDGLQYCPRWSQDATGIDATLFNLTEWAPSEPRPFRDLAEAANAYHGYVLKLERGRRLRFKPLPSKPVLTAPDAPGVAFRSLSRGSARQVYNRVLGIATDQSGQAVAVERWAAQQPGVVAEFVSTPSFPNPSFDVDASSWSSITRDAAVFDTAPASGRFTIVDLPSTTLSGTFVRGIGYLVTFKVRVANVDSHGKSVVYFRLGTATDYVTLALPMLTAGVFVAGSLFWLPRATAASGVTFAYTGKKDIGTNTTAVYIDSFSLSQARPTLLDRRGQVRTKVLSTNQSVDSATLQQLCDAWLQSHMRSQFRGDLNVAGRGLVDHLTGEGVDPFALGELTMELVHFPYEVDPDTGGLGRDGRMVQVTYDGPNDSAQVSIDDTAESFERLMARINLLSGQGGG